MRNVILCTLVIVALSGCDPKEDSSSNILYQCENSSSIIQIDTLPDSTIRYREWVKPSKTDVSPDYVKTTKRSGATGTGSCAHNQWRFGLENGRDLIVDDGKGCNSKMPPTGSLSIAYYYWATGEIVEKMSACWP